MTNIEDEKRTATIDASPIAPAILTARAGDKVEDADPVLIEVLLIRYG